MPTGAAEKLCIGCTQVHQTSAEERNSFTLEAKTSLVESDSLTSIHNFEDVEITDVIETPCVELEPVNPHNASFKTVIIQNFRYSSYKVQAPLDPITV